MYEFKRESSELDGNISNFSRTRNLQWKKSLELKKK